MLGSDAGQRFFVRKPTKSIITKQNSPCSTIQLGAWLTEIFSRIVLTVIAALKISNQIKTKEIRRNDEKKYNPTNGNLTKLQFASCRARTFRGKF
jgi:hypothetical protein